MERAMSPAWLGSLAAMMVWCVRTSHWGLPTWLSWPGLSGQRNTAHLLPSVASLNTTHSPHCTAQWETQGGQTDIDPTQHYRLTTNGEIIFLISIFSSNNVHLAYHMAQRANTGGQTAKLNQRNRIQNLKIILTFLTFYREVVTENINQAARVTWG